LTGVLYPSLARRANITLLAFLIFAFPCFAQSDEDRAVDDSVERALAFLKRMQETDGSWRDASQSNTAVTSLTIMAFLSAGHVPGEGPYADTVEKGVRWILKQQTAEGMFGSDMYHLGICTLLLAEVAGMTDAELGKEVRAKLEKSVALILRAQNMRNPLHKGGWRYSLDSYDADMSITGWQVLALRAAKNLGCNVPAERISLAVEFIKRCRDPRTGGYCYQPQANVTVPCTGTSILALALCGNEHLQSADLLRGGSYVLQNSPRWGSQYFFYEIYYSAQAMFQLGNNYWSVYRPRMHRVLFDNQQRSGAWLDQDGFGPNYATSMSVLALAVEYRLLPIYQRGEDSEKK